MLAQAFLSLFHCSRRPDDDEDDDDDDDYLARIQMMDSLSAFPFFIWLAAFKSVSCCLCNTKERKSEQIEPNRYLEFVSFVQA